MSFVVDLGRTRQKMALRARGIRDAPLRPLERAANDVAALARGTTSWKDVSGSTRKSVTPRFGGGGRYASRVTAGRASVFLEAGTGKYGKRGREYVIAPKNGGRLAFRMAGRWVFASHVIHPGIKPTHFMRDAAESYRATFHEAMIAAVHHAISRS